MLELLWSVKEGLLDDTEAQILVRAGQVQIEERRDGRRVYHLTPQGEALYKWLTKSHSSEPTPDPRDRGSAHVSSP